MSDLPGQNLLNPEQETELRKLNESLARFESSLTVIKGNADEQLLAQYNRVEDFSAPNPWKEYMEKLAEKRKAVLNKKLINVPEKVEQKPPFA